MRVHELAKELNVSSKDLIADLKTMGVEAKNHMSALDQNVIEKVYQKFNKSQKAKESNKKQDRIEEGKEDLQKKKKSHDIVSEPEKSPIAEELIKEEQKEEKVKKVVQVTIPITVKDLALILEVPVNQFIAKLIDLGEMLNQNDNIIDQDIILLLGVEFGCEIQFAVKTEETKELIVIEEEPSDPLKMVHRAPVVAFMGHVDHGKTSLLDQIRKTRVAEKEAGGITQHLGSYQVTFKQNKITFLDTPGHEAFTMMRARGAQVTDIVVLVIAADDGIMPQTTEAINHCKAANVPIIVAINKIDKPEVFPERIKRQLAEKDMLCEEWGGQTIICEVSAKTSKGIDHLLEMILLQSEMLELKADPTLKGRGIVIEAKQTTGRGPTANVLVRKGTFKIGDPIVCGSAYGKIKAIISDQGQMLREAGPSTPVILLGLSKVPEIGVEIKSVKSEKLARELSEIKAEELKRGSDYLPKKMTLEDIFEKISNESIKEFRMILKADVRGSMEALESCLNGIKSEKIEIKIIHQAVGDVTENDVMLASASDAVIIGFQVKASVEVKDLAEKEGVNVRLYSIIYEIVEDVKKALEGMLEPLESESVIGHAIIQKVFELSKSGKVAGCMVGDGKILRSARARLMRNGEKLFEGSLQSLKRFKDEVREVREGFECGLRLDGFDEIEEGDSLEFYEIKKTAQKI